VSDEVIRTAEGSFIETFAIDVKEWERGHPGGKVSLAQAGDVRTVYGASDMSQLRDAYDGADIGSLIANSNTRVFKPE
jgi:hypothetical protein